MKQRYSECMVLLAAHASFHGSHGLLHQALHLLIRLCRHVEAGGQVVEDGKRFNMVRSVAAQPVLIQLPVE